MLNHCEYILVIMIWKVYKRVCHKSMTHSHRAGSWKIKIKQQISGCFRTDSGADDFAKLHSIAETAMKNGNSKYNAILAVVKQ